MTYTAPVSYSGLSLYRKCPKAWADTYIAGNRSPSGPAAQRGVEIHKRLEDFFGGGKYPTLAVLSPWRNYMLHLREAGNFTAECQWGANAQWVPEPFESASHVRGALDLGVHAPSDDTMDIYDWKTGRVYPEHVKQGEFYAALALTQQPDAQLFNARFVYIDAPTKVAEWTYTRPEVEVIRDALDAEIHVLRLDSEYLPTPSNNACQWCSLSWRKGGTCREAP